MNKMKRKSLKRKSLKRKSLKRRSLKRRSLKRRSLKRRSLKRRSLDGANVKDIIFLANKKIVETEKKLKLLDINVLDKFEYNEVIKTVMEQIKTDIKNCNYDELKDYVQAFFDDVEFIEILKINKKFKNAFFKEIKISFFNESDLDKEMSEVPVNILPNVKSSLNDYIHNLKDENNSDIYFKSDFHAFLKNYKDLDIFNIIVDEDGKINNDDFNIDFIVDNYNKYTTTHDMTLKTYKLLHIIIRTKIVNFILTNKKPFIINDDFIKLLKKNDGYEVMTIFLKDKDNQFSMK
jgi:hypothetical protein